MNKAFELEHLRNLLMNPELPSVFSLIIARFFSLISKSVAKLVYALGYESREKWKIFKVLFDSKLKVVMIRL